MKKSISKMKEKANLLRLLKPKGNESVSTPQPTSSTQHFKKNAADKVQNVKNYAKSKCNDFVDWLHKHVPPKPKIIDTAFEHVKNSILKLLPRKKKIPKKEEIHKKEESFEVEETKSALKNFTIQYTIPGKDGYDPDSFLDSVKETVIKLFENNRETKVKMILRCIMERVNIKTGQIHTCDKQFHSEMEINLQSTDTYEIYTKMKDTIKERITKFLRSGSNWKFRSIIRLEVHTVKYVPLKGFSYIPLPQELAKKKAIINLKNNDNQCFKWAVARALNPKQRDAQLIDKYLQAKAKELNWENI